MNNKHIVVQIIYIYIEIHHYVYTKDDINY